jgi:8-amino-7-oxononanoate synthase
MDREEWIDAELADICKRGLERRTQAFASIGGKHERDGQTLLNFASNDYLDLARHPGVIAGAGRMLEVYGAGATASRVVSGTLEVHAELERAIAAFKSTEAALCFGSGFLANVGTIPALVGRGDHVFLDRLAHASMIDAARLSRATIHRFRHNDCEHLETQLQSAPEGRRLVATESVFSMDGDLAPLPDIAGLADAHGAMLMIDEAHATGIQGPGGRGLIHAHDLADRVNVCMGTLSKAWGGYGGFIACSEGVRTLCVNRARSFVYTTAAPPAAVGAALAALAVIEADTELGTELLRRSQQFREQLTQGGLNVMDSQSQIIPILIGDVDRATRIAESLRDEGIIAVGIRPPTVPEGTARLRLSVTLAHTEEDLQRAAGIITSVAREAGLV